MLDEDRTADLGAVFPRPWKMANKVMADGQGQIRDYYIMW